MATKGECRFFRASQWFTLLPTLTTGYLLKPETNWRLTVHFSGQSSVFWSQNDTKTPGRVLCDVTRTAVWISAAGASLCFRSLSWSGCTPSPCWSSSCKRHVVQQNRYQQADPITDSNNEQMSPFHGKGRQRYTPYRFDLVGVGLTEVACERSSFAPLPSGMSPNRGFNCCLKQPSYCHCNLLGFIEVKLWENSGHCILSWEQSSTYLFSRDVDRFHFLFNGISAESWGLSDYPQIENQNSSYKSK